MCVCVCVLCECMCVCCVSVCVCCVNVCVCERERGGTAVIEIKLPVSAVLLTEY